MRILSHYFVARFLALFATILVAAMILISTVEIVLNLDEIASFRGGDGGTLRYLWLRLASYYLPDLLPIVSFAAAFVAFAWAGRSMELVAVEAGGIRPFRVLGPVLGAALILSCATAILHETLVLQAERSWAEAERGDQEEIEFGRRAFWLRTGRAIANVERADPETRTLRGVEIFERGATGTIVRVIRSDRARITGDGRWELADATVWSFDPVDATRPPRLDRHVALSLDLETLGGDALLGADPSLLPLPVLGSLLAEQSGTEASSTRRRLERRFHERLASPWLVLIFAWLALPFALRVDRAGRIAGPAAAGVAALGAFFVLRSAGATLAQNELLPTGVVPWIAPVVFGVAAGIALLRRAV